MKRLANIYTYTVDYKYNDDKSIEKTYSDLSVYRNDRLYKTKMKYDSLPEEYCDINRYYNRRELINTKNIKDIKYSWVKENHFMKDSVIRFSYSGELKPYYPTYKINGEDVKSIFCEYENLDWMVFGSDIFKFLGYVQKYSDYDLSEVKKEFITQCEWLKENEPCYAPETDDFGLWFDEHIKINQ